MQKVLIIGCGVVGGSIFKRLTEIHQEGKRVYDVTIYDPYMSEDNMESFINYCRSIDIEPKQYNPADFQEDLFDIAIVATPPSDNVRIHLEFELQIFTLALHVCDVSSVKNWISKWCDNNNFTSVHIMAGSEKTGFINSKADLHKGGNTVIFTKYNNIDRLYCYMPYCLMIIMWQDIVENAKITIQPSTCDTLKLHDDIVAFTSHLPQLFCFAIGDMIKTNPNLLNRLNNLNIDTCERLQCRLFDSNRELWKNIFKQSPMTQKREDFKILLHSIIEGKNPHFPFKDTLGLIGNGYYAFEELVKNIFQSHIMPYERNLLIDYVSDKMDEYLKNL
jgi:prephenate dehydrogenase